MTTSPERGQGVPAILGASVKNLYNTYRAGKASLQSRRPEGGVDPLAQAQFSEYAEEELEEVFDKNKDLVTAIKDEDVKNTTDQRIDFNGELLNLQKNTETTLPYTMTQVADAMYLDQYAMITFEYHCYQTECLYTMLKPVDPLDEVAMEQSPLQTHKFNVGYEPHPMSAFDRDGITNYRDTNQDIFEEDKLKQQYRFMRIDNQEDRLSLQQQSTQQSAQTPMSPRSSSTKGFLSPQQQKENSMVEDGPAQLVQGIICLYKLTPEGSLMKQQEVDCRMGRKFIRPANGNMQLTRSKDRKVVSLTNFDRNDSQGGYFHVLAWTPDLKKFDVSDRLLLALNHYYHSVKDSFDELVELAFCGRNQYVQLVYI